MICSFAQGAFGVICCLFLANTTLWAQDTTSFLDRLEFRQSFNSPDGKSAPVQFQMTFPNGKDASFLVDGGAAYTVKWWNGAKVFGEYHRNSLVEKEQHNWQAGFSGAWYSALRFNEAKTTYTRWFVSPSLKYVRDMMLPTHSLALNLDALPIRTGERGLNLATNTLSPNKRLIHFALLSGGTEIQENFSAQNVGLEGFIFRPTVKTQYSLSGNKKRANLIEPIKTWSLTLDYDAWYDLVNTTDYSEQYTHFLKGGFDYFFLSAKENPNKLDLSVGISYNYGAKPQQSLPKQQFWLFTLHFQK